MGNHDSIQNFSPFHISYLLSQGEVWEERSKGTRNYLSGHLINEISLENTINLLGSRTLFRIATKVMKVASEAFDIDFDVLDSSTASHRSLSGLGDLFLRIDSTAYSTSSTVISCKKARFDMLVASEGTHCTFLCVAASFR